ESLDIAQTIDRQHGTDLGDELFEKFQEKHPQPTLDQVQDATYEDGNDSWESMLKDSVSREKQGMDQHQLSEIAKQIGNHKSSRMSPKMQQTQNSLAKDVATENLEKVDKMDAFLPELDHMISNKLIPDIERTMNAGRKLGVSEEDILERYNSPVKVLESYIASDLKDKQRYDSIVRKIDNVNPMQMNKMMADAAKNDNQMAMAALGAADLGQAMTSAQSMQMADGSSAQDILAQAIDKSIGGGTNLLKQWFMHRRNLPKPIKDKLRDMMRKTLLEIGMEWANKGTGSSEEGIIPVTDTRPYRDGDELDLIDIEATLSSLIMSGKQLNQMTTDELMVTETSKGKTSLGVLIDISGSMSGQNLAMCAVSVVMLLGKLDQKEVAIALFESNTHKIKGFEDETTLDKVADELLDLEARGGTRADSALRWIGNEFNTVTSSDVKILFFLSDYYLSENTEALTKLMEPMIHEGVKILGAYHGNYDRRRMEHMVNMMDGSSLKITNFEKLPESISDAIASITE
ncbi:MAG: VWA domain-containing protein, partial [Candidatus Kariarchaeaceae archaeon]